MLLFYRNWISFSVWEMPLPMGIAFNQVYQQQSDTKRARKTGRARGNTVVQLLEERFGDEDAKNL